jgi:hypothetical protein
MPVGFCIHINGLVRLHGVLRRQQCGRHRSVLLVHVMVDRERGWRRRENAHIVELTRFQRRRFRAAVANHDSGASHHQLLKGLFHGRSLVDRRRPQAVPAADGEVGAAREEHDLTGQQGRGLNARNAPIRCS